MLSRVSYFIVHETVFLEPNHTDTNIHYLQYSDQGDEHAVERVVTLYNERRKEIKTASGRMPPVLSDAHIERMKKELKDKRATSLASPTKWNKQYTWTIHQV